MIPTTPKTPTTLPRLIITPSTPIPNSTSYFDEQIRSPFISTQQDDYHSDLVNVRISTQEKTRFKGRSNSITSNKTNEISEKPRPNPVRSYSLPLQPQIQYLTPHPSSIPSPRSGKRPLRSSIIPSIIFLIFTFLVLSSTIMCTSSSAGRLLDIQQKASLRIHEILKLDVGSEGSNLLIGSLNMNEDIPEDQLVDHEVGGISKSLLDTLWNKENWSWDWNSDTHPSIISAGPAISLDGGAIWDFDS